MPDRLMRKTEVLERLDVSEATLYRWLGDGSFPAPIKVGPRSVRWKESDFEKWITSRPVPSYGEGEGATA